MFGTRTIVFLGVTLGLFLLVVGHGVDSNGVVLTGQFIFPIALLFGGLSSSDEDKGLRITMLAIGGLFVTAAFTSSLLGLLR